MGVNIFIDYFYIFVNIQFFSRFLKVIAEVIYNIEVILRVKLVLIEMIFKFVNFNMFLFD